MNRRGFLSALLGAPVRRILAILLGCFGVLLITLPRLFATGIGWCVIQVTDALEEAEQYGSLAMKWVSGDLQVEREREALLAESAERCPECDTPVMDGGGIGPYCPNKACGRIDDLQPIDAPKPTRLVAEVVSRHDWACPCVACRTDRGED